MTIARLDATTAWRARLGPCAGGGAHIEVSSGGGATWIATKTPKAWCADCVKLAISVASGTGWLLVGEDRYASKELQAWKKA